MTFHQVRILADENVSPKVVAFLRDQGIDVDVSQRTLVVVEETRIRIRQTGDRRSE